MELNGQNIFKPADIVFCRDGSLTGLLIRWATRSRGEEKSWAHHVAGFVDYNYACESQWRVKTLHWTMLLADFEVWRNVAISDNERTEIAIKACDYCKRQFGFSKLFTHLLDSLMNKVRKKPIFLFRRLNHNDDYPICSWIWAFSYQRKLDGYEFGVPAESADPDQMHDWVRARPDEWVLVAKRVNGRLTVVNRPEAPAHMKAAL